MLIVICPHCNKDVLIEKLNCRIFRHGVYIKTGRQLGAHAKQKHCEKVIRENLIYGCGKPFKVNKENVAEICDYI